MSKNKITGRPKELPTKAFFRRIGLEHFDEQSGLMHAAADKFEKKKGIFKRRKK